MKPYTYYLYHRPTGLKYYGVRYAKNCDPKDLWNKYFTSCKKVKELITEDGINSFDFKIRKIFESKVDAINWENKVLRRLKVKRKKEWINISEGKMPFDNITYGMLGKHHSEDSKKKIALAQTGSKNHMFNKTHSAEARKKISEGNKGKRHSEETKTIISKKMKGRDVGFGKGYKHTPETIEKIKMGVCDKLPHA